MNLTSGVSIQAGDVITRQTLYDAVANAVGGQVEASDLDPGLLNVLSQSEAPLATPGRVWWDKTDKLLKVYVDVLDGTGVSVWLAIGPDRYDTPLLATEPIPFGAMVQITRAGGRSAKLPPNSKAMAALGQPAAIWEMWKVVGFNNNGAKADAATTPSGTWFACAIEGYCWAWYGCWRTPGASVGTASAYDSIVSGMSGLSGATETAGMLLSSSFTSSTTVRHLPAIVRSPRAIVWGPIEGSNVRERVLWQGPVFSRF